MDIDYLKKTIRSFVVGILICVFMLLLDGMGWIDPVYSSVNFVMEPLEYFAGRSVVSVQGFFSTITQIGVLSSQNNELKIDNAKLLAQISNIKEIEVENELLKDQLELTDDKEWQLEKARVLGLENESTVGSIVIDIGEDKDVHKNDVVIIGMIYLGRVSAVYKSTATVQLITDYNSNIICLDQETRAKGIVHGSLDGLVFEDVLENEELNVGDTVITWEDDIPQDLIIGKISKLEDSPTSSTKKSYVDIGFAIEDVDYVFVVIDY
ncbi:rod shape-determining protein MreC [Candidatus Dojkabacteria bacterium]|nr:rod shape-determining protein MreC [Candidatus Dojkabacteria bacterium]